MSNEEKILTMLTGLSNDLGELASAVNNHGVVLEKLVSNVEKLEEGQVKLEINLTRLEQLVQDTKESVVLLENEQSRRIGALYDANERLYDMMKKALFDVSAVESRLDMHSIDIARLYVERTELNYKLNKLLRNQENERNSA